MRFGRSEEDGAFVSGATSSPKPRDWDTPGGHQAAAQDVEAGPKRPAEVFTKPPGSLPVPPGCGTMLA